MRVINILRLIEEQLYTNSSSRNFSGAVSDLEFLMQHSNDLNKVHKGLFAYFAFHPFVDEDVAKYIASGAVDADSGPEIMVMFITNRSCEIPRTVTAEILNTIVPLRDGENVPDYMLRSMFPGKPEPIPPGIIFFDRIFGNTNAVYISLSNETSLQEIADATRKALRSARSCVLNGVLDPGWVSCISAEMQREGIRYQRTGHTSSAEWFQTVLRKLGEENLSLVTIISTVAKLVEKFVK